MVKIRKWDIFTHVPLFKKCNFLRFAVGKDVPKKTRNRMTGHLLVYITANYYDRVSFINIAKAIKKC